MFRTSSRVSSNDGAETRTTGARISSLFNNNLLFNTKPRRTEDEALDEEDETSDVSYEDFDSQAAHNMNDRELVMEAYMGYFIGAITLTFLSLLIFGYVKTTEIPLCMCANGTDTIWNDICLDAEPLTLAEINECQCKIPQLNYIT